MDKVENAKSSLDDLLYLDLNNIERNKLEELSHKLKILIDYPLDIENRILNIKLEVAKMRAAKQKELEHSKTYFEQQVIKARWTSNAIEERDLYNEIYNLTEELRVAQYVSRVASTKYNLILKVIKESGVVSNG